MIYDYILFKIEYFKVLNSDALLCNCVNNLGLSKFGE
jgi:hypothetical protein